MSKPRVLHKEIDGIENKQCFRCKAWFPIKRFGVQTQTWDKLRVLCSTCDQKVGKGYGRRYYSKNKKQCLEKKAEYRKRNKDKIAAWHAKNYKKNKDKILKAVALRRKNNPERVEGYKKVAALWRKNNPEKIKEYTRAADKKKCSTPKGRLSDNISRKVAY